MRLIVKYHVIVKLQVPRSFVRSLLTETCCEFLFMAA